MQLNHLAPMILNTELATMNQLNQSSIVNLPGSSEHHVVVVHGEWVISVRSSAVVVDVSGTVAVVGANIVVSLWWHWGDLAQKLKCPYGGSGRRRQWWWCGDLLGG